MFQQSSKLESSGIAWKKKQRGKWKWIELDGQNYSIKAKVINVSIEAAVGAFGDFISSSTWKEKTWRHFWTELSGGISRDLNNKEISKLHYWR